MLHLYPHLYVSTSTLAAGVRAPCLENCVGVKWRSAAGGIKCQVPDVTDIFRKLRKGALDPT
jgi:hypothetical protein